MQGSAAGDLSRSSAATPVGQAGAGSNGATTAAAAEPVSELEADALRQAAAGLLLPFQKAMVEELLEEDGLCVMSPGLGLHQVVAVLLRLQDTRLRQRGQRGVVLVLGASPWQRDALRRELRRIDPAIRQRASAAVGAGGSARAAAAFEVPAEVTNEVPAAERQALYSTASCLFVTTRILVVDQLSGRITADQVAGMIVLNAHRVTDSSGEGFAVRLYKSSAPRGVVRAFSDIPSSFASEFNKVEKVMKALYVRRLYLWPRFQAQTRHDLEARPPQLVELSQPMSAAMGLIYEAITELMDACVKELKRSNNKLDTTDLTVDQSLFRNFDEVVRRQLASIWHTVSPKTRQIVADLRTLRSLASFMLRFDAVTFMSYLDNLRATEGVKSVWLFHSAAHAIFEAAKSRVYRLKQGSVQQGQQAQQRKRKAGSGSGDAEAGTGTGAPARQAAPQVEAVLEGMPKWELLREVLEEVQAERQRLRQLASSGADATAGGGGGGSRRGGGGGATGGAAAQDADDGVIALEDDDAQGHAEGRQHPNAGASAAPAQQVAEAPVLVVCQDTFTAGQLREVLKSGGPEQLMQRLYRDYLAYKLEGGRSAGLRHAVGARPDDAGAPGEQPPQARMMGGYRPGEEVALIKEAKALAGPSAGGGTAPGARARGGGRGGRGTNGRNGRSGRGRGRGKSAAADAAAAAAALAVASTSGRGHLESPPPPGVSHRAYDGAAPASAAGAGAAAADGVAGQVPGAGSSGGGAAGRGAVQAAAHPLLEGVRFVALEGHDVMSLWEACPAFVVMYDPDVAFTRQLEVYKASRPGWPLCVYLLRYDDSFEMDRYQLAVKREREVFESLIRNKEIMILPISAGREQVDPARRLPATHHEDALLLGAGANALTRRAGGRGGRPLPTRVVVDVREFMSSLPAVLHQQGLEVVPLTLEVGDYVLSPDICCERKSIADLKGSLASGRLYHQAEAMSKHYKTPVLLIEFEGDKAFALQASSEIGDDVQLHSLMSKVALLCLHFPRLRLIWSRSLHATADIFQQLKANQEEPDPVAAATVGVPDEAERTSGGAPIEAVVNQSAIDLLRRLPGVTDGNYRALMREAGSLAELADLPLDRLSALMGGQAAAKRLHEFLHQQCKALFGAL